MGVMVTLQGPRGVQSRRRSRSMICTHEKRERERERKTRYHVFFWFSVCTTEVHVVTRPSRVVNRLGIWGPYRDLRF